LKVLITIPCLLQGGTELQTLSLSKVLQSCGHKVCVLCYFEFDDYIVEEFHSTGSKVELLNLNRMTGPLSLINILRVKIRSVKPDIVHVQYMAPGTLPIIAARLAVVKRIFATVHQPYTKSHGRRAKIMLRASSLLTTRFIAVSQYAEKSWFGTSGLFDETKPLKLQPHHFTIHNAIDAERIQKIISAVNIDDLKSELAIPAGIPVIGAVSRLRHEKGIDLLIDAFNQLIKSGVNAHLLLVGNGPNEKTLKDNVQLYELNSNVTFYGKAEWERAMQLMSVMDIVAVPSRFEGFGLTAAEARAMGKPVVASDTSGLKEVVIDDETGILFPVENSKALKAALEHLIRDPNLRDLFGNAGRERVIRNFSLELFSKKIKALYNL
jgi:glycosyltransferase involved in cell wall biosynthesis